MATRNPIENYLRGEEIDNQPYFSKGISRRGFLKLAGGTALGAVFGEGFLKQMEAWAEDGIVVYVNSKNMNEGLLMKLESSLNRSGVKTTEYVRNADIEIKLGILFKKDDPDIQTPGLTRHDSASISVKYIKPDGSSESVTYPKINADFLESYIDSLGNDMANYLMEIKGRKKVPKNQSGCNLDVKEEETPRVSLEKKVWDGLRDPDPKVRDYWIKALEKDKIKIGSDGIPRMFK